VVSFEIPPVVWPILSLLLGGGLLGVLLKHRRDYPGAMAAARKVGAEAERVAAETDDIKISSLERQVKRLDERVQMLEGQVEECQQDRDLALAAARFLFDRLSIASPSDEALEKLRPYLTTTPDRPIPRWMGRKITEVDEAEASARRKN
jgi:hypothetical protein